MTLLSRSVLLLALVAPLPALAVDDEPLPPPPPIPEEELEPAPAPPPPAPEVQAPAVEEPAPSRPIRRPARGPARRLDDDVEERTVAPAPTKEPPGFGSSPFLFTLGAAAVGAIGLGVLTFLNPCCCGLPFSVPLGGLSLGLGALIGTGLYSDWDFGTTLLGGLIGGGCGLASGLAAGTSGAVLALALGATAPDPGVNVGLAQGGALAILAGAGLLAGTVLLLGGAAAGAAVVWGYPMFEADDEPRKRRRPRRRPRRGEIEPALPAAPAVAMAF